MKIKIENIPDTYNYGSAMMAINLINLLNKKINNVEFYVDCLNEDNLYRLKHESRVEKIYFEEKFLKLNELNKYKRFLSRIKKESEYYDAKIILGGDDISEYYGKKQWKLAFPIMYVKSKILPTYLIGQTIGPFTSYRKILARMALNKARIYTRDNNCFEYLQELGVKSMENGRDLAFLNLPNESKTMQSKYNLKRNEYIVFVPSGLSRCYTDNREAYRTQMVKIVNDICNNKKLLDKKIVLLSHVPGQGSASDTIMINEIIQNINPDIKNRIVSITDTMLPSEAREILGGGIFTITGRMHAAVSTFYMRRPAISLSYSVKYAGVIGNGLEMNELIIECKDKSTWEYDEISESVIQKVVYVLDNYNYLVKKIDENVEKTSLIVENQIESLIKQLKELG